MPPRPLHARQDRATRNGHERAAPISASDVAPSALTCPRWACQSCGRVDEDVPLVAISNVASSIERRLCRGCIARVRVDALTIVEELVA